MDLKYKRIGFRVSLFLGSILGILLCATCMEILLRLENFSYQLYLGKIEFSYPAPAVIYTYFAFDKDLFWAPKNYYTELNAAKITKPAIVFMGDSCSDERALYPKHLLYLASKEFPDKNITYFIGGVGGWSSYQGLQQLRRDILDLKPKIITIYFGWNDHWLGFGIADKDAARVNSSFLSRFQNLRLTQLIIKNQVVMLQRIQGIKKRPIRVSSEDFRSNLRQMVKLAKGKGIVPVLLTAPSSHEKGKEPQHLAMRCLSDLSDLVPLHQRYVSIVRDVAREENVILCDLAEDFEALPKDEVRNKYFYGDGIHPTPEGNKKIAEFLYRCFKKNNLLEQL